MEIERGYMLDSGLRAVSTLSVTGDGANASTRVTVSARDPGHRHGTPDKVMDLMLEGCGEKVRQWAFGFIDAVMSRTGGWPVWQVSGPTNGRFADRDWDWRFVDRADAESTVGRLCMQAAVTDGRIVEVGAQVGDDVMDPGLGRRFMELYGYSAHPVDGTDMDDGDASADAGDALAPDWSADCLPGSVPDLVGAVLAEAGERDVIQDDEVSVSAVCKVADDVARQRLDGDIPAMSWIHGAMAMPGYVDAVRVWGDGDDAGPWASLAQDHYEPVAMARRLLRIMTLARLDDEGRSLV